jgi:hypothetical protein
MRVTPLMLSLALCASAAGPAAAQVGPAQPPSMLPENALLRLQLADSSIVTGRLLAWETQQIHLHEIVRRSVTDARLVRRAVPHDSVARAWVREGSYWKRGAILGLVAGTVSMFVTLHVAVDELECGPAKWKCVWSSVGVGGLPGAALGALIGGGTIRWRLLF